MPQADLRRQLLQKKNDLGRRLDRIRRDRRRTGKPLSPDFSEQAVERENDEALDFLDARIRTELRAIEAALERFDAGAFGRCTECGEAISERRIESVPTTSVCASCAGAEEQPAATRP